MKDGQKTYDSLTAKFLAVAAECMPNLQGEVIQGWIENPAALKRALAVLDQAEIPHGAEGVAKQIWREYEIGGKPAYEVIASLKEFFPEVGEDMLEHCEAWLEEQPAEPQVVKLVRIGTKELGFRKGTYFDRVLERGHELGLRDIEQWMVPYLRLAYRDQVELIDEALCLTIPQIEYEVREGGLMPCRVELSWLGSSEGPDFYLNPGDPKERGDSFGDLPGYVKTLCDFLFLAAE